MNKEQREQMEQMIDKLLVFLKDLAEERGIPLLTGCFDCQNERGRRDADWWIAPLQMNVEEIQQVLKICFSRGYLKRGCETCFNGITFT